MFGFFQIHMLIATPINDDGGDRDHRILINMGLLAFLL